MRVLLIVLNQPGKGTYWRAFHLGQCLAKRGHHVSLMATSAGSRFLLKERESGGLRLVEAPDLLPGALRSGWDPWDAARRITWLLDKAFDITHVFECRPTAIGPALVSQRRGSRLIMDWCDWFGRGGSVEERPNPLVRNALRPIETFFEEHFRTRADGTTVINNVLRQKAVGLGVRSEQILLLPNGADLERIRPQDRAQARARLGLPLDAEILVYTGAIFRRDALLMAEAFDRIHAVRPNTRLLLAGYCRMAVESLVRDSGAVWRTGPLDQNALADYLAAADLGWLPICDSGANRGRFPMKLHDYLAAGLPIVASDVGDVGAVFRDDHLGLITAAQPEALAEAALAILGSAGAAAEMGRNARAVAEARFAWPDLANRVEQFYSNILARRTDPSVLSAIGGSDVHLSGSGVTGQAMGHDRLSSHL